MSYFDRKIIHVLKNPPVILVGVGAEAHAAAEILQMQGLFLYGYLYIDKPPAEPDFDDIPVLGAIAEKQYQQILQKEPVDYFIADNNPHIRQGLFKRMFEICKKLPLNAVHPSVMLSPSVDMATGNFIFPQATIGRRTTIDVLNIMGAGSVIESFAKVGSHNYIGSRVVVAENAVIQDFTIIGAGAIITNGVKIGTGAMVAPGAVVLSHVEANTSVAGNPAVVVANTAMT